MDLERAALGNVALDVFDEGLERLQILAEDLLALTREALIQELPDVLRIEAEQCRHRADRDDVLAQLELKLLLGNLREERECVLYVGDVEVRLRRG